MDLITTILPVVTKDLPISPRFTPYDFLSRCKFSTLTTRQPMVEFYLLTFPRFPLRKKEHKSYFGKTRTHDFRTSRCAGYLLLIDHSGDEGYSRKITVSAFSRGGVITKGGRGVTSVSRLMGGDRSRSCVPPEHGGSKRTRHRQRARHQLAKQATWCHVPASNLLQATQ